MPAKALANAWSIELRTIVDQLPKKDSDAEFEEVWRTRDSRLKETPGFIAFKDRTNAEKFQKGFGGEVVTYPEALKIWAEIKKVGH